MVEGAQGTLPRPHRWLSLAPGQGSMMATSEQVWRPAASAAIGSEAQNDV